MKVTTVDIPGSLLLEPCVFGDARGFFTESFNRRVFSEATGANPVFVQDNHPRSQQNEPCGMDYQVAQTQGKAIREVRGRPLRVLEFGRFWNDQHGGVERHVSELCTGLAAQGFDIVNLVASENLKRGDKVEHGFRVVQAPSFGKLFSTAMSPALLLKAAKLHRETPFDLFHLHFPDPLTHAASLMLPASVPRVITWHSDIVKQKRLFKLYGPFLRREVLRSQAVVAATQAHFDSSTQIPAALPASKRHVIPYGMDYAKLALDERTSRLRDELRAMAGMADVGGAPRKIVFALGRHVYYKGFDVLLKAMKHCDAFLILGGDGPMRPELHALAESLDLRNRVYFSGRIAEEDLAAYFNACDVFCLSSVTQIEAFGLVQLEAMACGKPVVCTRLGTGVNVVNVEGVTGLAVEPGDAAALGECLEGLLCNDGLRERLGAQARSWARDEYSLDAMVRRHIALYEDIGDSARPHR
ncbi:glycosyltransferase [Variovorax terrae]|uniref:dTDP-4-dehydrorhamnose 3,5-epimerase n=1 Tax=Variovorax terrae TaxID=2923278 RepID=A0A9X1VRU5_9BURK|nr:glycosyltransferase [Variovorax terrae]MCJ0761859.1 glycosyltransferase [Variovorax terrae]